MRISPGHCLLLNLSSRDAVPSTAGTVTTDNLSYLRTKSIEMRSNGIIANIRDIHVSVVCTYISRCMKTFIIIHLFRFIFVLFHLLSSAILFLPSIVETLIFCFF